MVPYIKVHPGSNDDIIARRTGLVEVNTNRRKTQKCGIPQDNFGAKDHEVPEYLVRILSMAVPSD